jgi:hypothetical protein
MRQKFGCASHVRQAGTLTPARSLHGLVGCIFFPRRNTATYETKLSRFFRFGPTGWFARVLLERNIEHQRRVGESQKTG